MAEFLLTFAVEEVLKKVVKVAAEQIGLAWGLEKDLEELREWLLKTEAFLRDINKRKLHSDSVRLWVDKLQDLVHEAEDLLDELLYEDLRRKVQTAKMKKVRNFVSPSNNAFVFRLKMANRMNNIRNLLCKHYYEGGPLGLVGNEPVETETDISQLRETVSELDDFEVVGRDVEVSSIVDQVIDTRTRNVTSILPIVGMGGLGKTTLAKLVFNHERVKQHFDETIWVCVSEPFIVNKILGAILETIRGASSGSNNKEVLLRELKKEMHDKSYFLVLDDIWNENPSLWDELKNCLMRITQKSENTIVVTTRSVEVAKIMETLPSHHLSKLSDDQCWSLFQESANINGLPMTSSLKVVHEELVKKIGGIPLVAKVLGRAVKFQGDYDRWVAMLESEIRTPSQEENFALYILKLSVDRLPSFLLKQCFAYGSNFPKDFVFEKEELIKMWMAQGLFIYKKEATKQWKMKEIGTSRSCCLAAYFKTFLKMGEGELQAVGCMILYTTLHVTFQILKN